MAACAKSFEGLDECLVNVTPHRAGTYFFVYRWPFGLHVKAAVDAPDLAGDVCGGVRGQEVDYAGDLFGMAQPADRNGRLDLVQHLFRDVLEHLGGDEAGRHCVHGDADAVLFKPPCPGEDERRLLGEGLGQAEHAGLGRSVVCLADVPGLANDRGHEDDATGPAFDHVLQRRLSHVERTRQVHRKNRVPVLYRHLHGHLVHRDTRVVDQDVDPAVLLEHLLDHPAAVFGVGDVALVDGCAPGTVEVPRELLDELIRTVLVPAVPRGDRGALAGQAPADRGADTPGASGDQGHPTGELVAYDSGGWFDNGRADVVHEVPSR